ncbi:MAG: alpha/beta hydrolase [Bacilli bacterium]|jgi:alpha-beta hydrolase superfamily lysophospholipase|nr:alpha/beta hydrolase [Bacilli bacterium]
MPIWLILVIVIASLLLITLLIWLFLSFSLFHACFDRNYSPSRIFNDERIELDHSKGDNWLEAHKVEGVKCLSKDGLHLVGSLVINQEQTSLYVIAIHGFHGLWTSHVELMSELDERIKANYLLINQRGSGLSEGRWTSMGVKEKEDLLQWIEFLKKRDPKCKIILYGASLGGSTILMSLDKIDEHVCCGIADSAFADPYEQTIYTASKSLKGLARPAMWGANLLAQLFLHINLKDQTEEKAERNNKTPILLIHSAEDNFIPPLNLEKNYERLNDKMLKEKRLFEHGKHALIFWSNRQEYLKTVLDFLNESRAID